MNDPLVIIRAPITMMCAAKILAAVAEYYPDATLRNAEEGAPISLRGALIAEVAR